eukprot:Hpha_TRINITY_DN2208_c0_g2::TRINITY_DN2208_c0_g2_i1::g.25435::m.25435
MKERIVQVAMGSNFAVGVTRDWKVKVWGVGLEPGMNVTEELSRICRGHGGVKEVAAGARHAMALCRDGTVLAWGGGSSVNGWVGVTVLQTRGRGVVAIRTSVMDCYAVCKDGIVLVWVNPPFGDSKNPEEIRPPPHSGGVSDIAVPFDSAMGVASSSDIEMRCVYPSRFGDEHRQRYVYAMCKNGSVHQIDESPPCGYPWSDEDFSFIRAHRGASAISSSRNHLLVLCKDGTVCVHNDPWPRGTFDRRPRAEALEIPSEQLKLHGGVSSIAR